MVTTWRQFSTEVRSQGCSKLLQTLGNYPNALLVSGCQRSGTTMLANLLLDHPQIADYRQGGDSELEGALLLAGYGDEDILGRYCFQTTYLNECVNEYHRRQSDFHLIWLVRNPYSVIYSMLNNWKQYAIEELFNAVGKPFLSLPTKLVLHYTNRLSLFKQACYAYVGKNQQLFALREQLTAQQLTVLDYDKLVGQKQTLLPRLFQQLNLDYQPVICDHIHSQSQQKARHLPPEQAEFIKRICLPLYEQVCVYSL